MSLPSSMKAYKCTGAGSAQVKTVPLPALRPDYLLVKISAVALNPTDWKHIHSLPTENATVGCDWAGIVVEVGDKVNKSFKKGDRVAGVAHGVNAIQPEDGSFGEYAVVKGDLAMRIPDNVTDEEAATTGVSITTVGQALYQSLGLPMPSSPSKHKDQILIYGGSTATGLYALQYAKLSGFTAITTCSSHNFDLVKKYGADEVFDYKDPECGRLIRELTKNKLEYAFDTISTKESAQICADALSTEGKPKYSNLLKLEFPREDVEAGYTLAYTVIGEAFEFRGGTKFPASEEDLEFGIKMWGEAGPLMGEGKVKAPPMDVRKGGLESIGEGLSELKDGKVSGKKLVYPIA